MLMSVDFYMSTNKIINKIKGGLCKQDHAFDFKACYYRTGVGSGL